MPWTSLLSQLLDPTHLLTHLPYALLVISMLMNDMSWLRGIAISAGIVRIINRGFIAVAPGIVVWEVIFVAVNVAQLAIVWYYRKRHRFDADEKRLADNLSAGTERHIVRRLLRLSQIQSAAPDTVLTEEGKSVGSVFFITDGIVQIEKAGRIVGVCGPGDFVGEMSFLSGEPASATARVVKPVRYFAFSQERLRNAAGRDGDLRQALLSGFSRNLIGKLSKANSAESTR
jgi:hypothetical protein